MSNPKPRCPGCGHVQHRDECRGKAAQGCVTLTDPATGDPTTGVACYRGARPPCRCPYGLCHTCRAVIVGASPLPLGSAGEIDLDVDLAFNAALVPGDQLAARMLEDGSMAVRELAAGETPVQALTAGWHPVRAHVHQLAQVGAR